MQNIFPWQSSYFVFSLLFSVFIITIRRNITRLIEAIAIQGKICEKYAYRVLISYCKKYNVTGTGLKLNIESTIFAEFWPF